MHGVCSVGTDELLRQSQSRTQLQESREQMLYTDVPASATAEIAAWDANGDWIHPNYEEWRDDVQGYQTPEQVMRFMVYVQNQPRKTAFDQAVRTMESF